MESDRGSVYVGTLYPASPSRRGFIGQMERIRRVYPREQRDTNPAFVLEHVRGLKCSRCSATIIIIKIAGVGLTVPRILLPHLPRAALPNAPRARSRRLTHNSQVTIRQPLGLPVPVGRRRSRLWAAGHPCVGARRVARLTATAPGHATRLSLTAAQRQARRGAGAARALRRDGIPFRR